VARVGVVREVPGNPIEHAVVDEKVLVAVGVRALPGPPGERVGSRSPYAAPAPVDKSVMAALLRRSG